MNIDLPKYGEKIGLAMSGGMDSALLAYVLFEAQKVIGFELTVYTVDLGNSIKYVKDILNFIGVNPEIKLIPNPKNPNGALSPQFIEIMETVDRFYTGTTRNPDWADSIPAGEKPHRYVKIQWRNLYMPFGTSSKDAIVALYFEMELDKSLLPLTHTCTERLDTNCGVCFACRERKWAFDASLNKDCITYE